jgi:hypothetical protein
VVVLPTAGCSTALTVTARDAGGATLQANYTFLPDDAGVHAFGDGVTLATVTEKILPPLIRSQGHHHRHSKCHYRPRRIQLYCSRDALVGVDDVVLDGEMARTNMVVTQTAQVTFGAQVTDAAHR